MRLVGSAIAALIAAMSQPAVASVYSDDLAKCLVSRTTEAEKTDMMRWIFAAMSAHPAVSAMSTVTVAQRTALNTRYAQLTEQLLTDRCRTEAVAALKADAPRPWRPASICWDRSPCAG